MHAQEPRSEIALDPLSITLAGLAWTGWSAGIAELPPHWGVEVPEGTVSLYVVLSGRMAMSAKVIGEPTRVGAGEVVLFPHGSAHELRSQAGQEVVDYREVFRPVRHEGFGEGAEEPTSILFGHQTTAGCGRNPLHGQLSSHLRLRMTDYDILERSEMLIQAIRAEQEKPTPGWRSVVNQLTQTLFHQTLRAFVSQAAHGNGHPRSESKALVSDPSIGLVVGLLHAQPERPWTVASLARWVNMSRSAFSERFRDVVGKPPLNYLTELRMDRACDLLSRSELGIKQIATLVGYESPSSFTNAFKRWRGTSPASYRTTHFNGTD